MICWPKRKTGGAPPTGPGALDHAWPPGFPPATRAADRYGDAGRPGRPNGFLLSLPFTNRFSRLSHGQRELYLATLVLAAVATALLLGPVAYHRLVFRRGQKEGLVRAASMMAIAGLATVGLAVSAAVLLVTGYVASGLAAALITAFVTCVFGLLWFAFPLARRR
jgi:hypothetical protein